ncbi:ATP-binding cassette domain-containing protein [Peribacillus tepidiphilus]|uniref:ATP-binding cassette domain-containing protein n=1 Tax=Peribacillus tepidiphilus TaxID=2652445 RepID=UPI0035B55CAA
MTGVELERVSKVYQAGEVTVQALKNFSSQFPNGKITVILGPSGSRKSTFLNVIGGI